MRYYNQDLDEEVNVPDLQNLIKNEDLLGLVDEEKGGIVGYIHREHATEIRELLNKNAKVFKEVIQCLNQIKNTKVNSKYVKDTYELINLLENHTK